MEKIKTIEVYKTGLMATVTITEELHKIDASVELHKTNFLLSSVENLESVSKEFDDIAIMMRKIGKSKKQLGAKVLVDHVNLPLTENLLSGNESDLIMNITSKGTFRKIVSEFHTRGYEKEAVIDLLQTARTGVLLDSNSYIKKRITSRCSLSQMVESVWRNPLRY